MCVGVDFVVSVVGVVDLQQEPPSPHSQLCPFVSCEGAVVFLQQESPSPQEFNFCSEDVFLQHDSVSHDPHVLSDVVLF
jgi:hypothetical protein